MHAIEVCTINVITIMPDSQQRAALTALFLVHVPKLAYDVSMYSEHRLYYII